MSSETQAQYDARIEAVVERGEREYAQRVQGLDFSDDFSVVKVISELRGEKFGVAQQARRAKGARQIALWERYYELLDQIDRLTAEYEGQVIS